MNRRKFLTNIGKLGVFTILPGAGRVWKAERKPFPIQLFRSPQFHYIPTFADFLKIRQQANELLAQLDPNHAPILPHLS